MKVKMKLIIIAALLLIVTMAAFSVFLNLQLSTTSQTMFDQYLSDVSRMQANTLDKYTADIKARYNTIIAMPALQKFTSGTYNSGSKEFTEAENALTSLVNSGTLTSAVVYDGSNNIVLKAGAVADTVTNAAGVCEVGAQDNVPVFFNEDGKTTYGVSVKSKVNNFNVGLVFKNTGVANIIKQSKGLIFVVDPLNSIATGVAGETYGGNYSKNDATAQCAPYKDAVLSASSEPVSQYNTDGTIVAYATSAGSGWKAVAYQETARAVQNTSSTISGVTGISVALVIICLVAVIIMVIAVTKPLYKIQDILIKISRGDHDARVDIMSKNEYGDLARVFNDIVDNIIVSESRYRTIIDMSDNIIFEWNLSTKEVSFSNNFNKKFSYRAPSDHFADSFLIKCKVHPEDAERYTSDLQKLEKGQNFKHNEYRIKNIYGDYIWVLIRTSSILDQEGKPIKIVGVIVDIDRAKKSENVLTARASFDSLTNVFNRETIEVAINNEIELIAARKSEFAILFVDIDDFKFYNDQYSHATGDQVLRFTATTIKNAVGDKGMVGRYGGDEFIVCIKDSDMNDPSVIAEQILKTLKEGFDSDSGDHFTVNVSIGISVIKDNTKRVEEIIGQADDAMYKIKKAGKSNFGYLET
ncbi:MAG: diguanylate cyclase [Ruminiclostridium sp.]|nr:diguanylate cyclase [Ruminiclostridium sp.]